MYGKITYTLNQMFMYTMTDISYFYANTLQRLLHPIHLNVLNNQHVEVEAPESER